MKKALAVLRTAIFLGFTILAIWNTPGDVWGSPDTMVQIRRVQGLWKVVWVAAGWMALEAAVTWLVALRRPKGGEGPKGRE